MPQPDKETAPGVLPHPNLPHIHGERCVHALIETASCRACVTACPRGAWHLDDDGLNLATDACDGCGLCVAACPQGALGHDDQPAMRQLGSCLIGLAACERSGLDGNGVMPCIHALSLNGLLAHQRMRSLLISTGHCQDCPRQPADNGLWGRLQALDAALRARNCQGISWREISAEQWRNYRARLPDGIHSRPMERRGFLRLGARAALAQLEPTEEKWTPPGSLLPELPGPLPQVPVIDAARCDGCDACLKLCPHGALSIADSMYLIRAERCSGCRICLDVCATQAISLLAWATPASTGLSLQSGRCRRCGAPFHRPAPANGDLCRVCAQANQHNRLYQVL